MVQLFIPVAVVVSLAVGALVFYRRRGRSSTARWLGSVAAAAATFAGIWILLVVTLLVLLFEPWPLSLRQGPDTEFAHACYVRHLGEAPPPSVTSVYCREEWGFGGDSIYSIRFVFETSSDIEGVVTSRGLVLHPDKDRPRYISGPGWWPKESELTRSGETYSVGGTEFLWVDSKNRTAYYQKANF